MSHWFGLKEVAQLRAVLTKLHDGFFFFFFLFPFHFLLSLTRTKVKVGNTDRELLALKILFQDFVALRLCQLTRGLT